MTDADSTPTRAVRPDAVDRMISEMAYEWLSLQYRPLRRKRLARRYPWMIRLLSRAAEIEGF